MGIAIKTIRGVAVTNLIILGLAACSSSPAPWTQADDSPWNAKHEAEAENVPSDEAVADISLNDPILLDDPEPVVMQEPEIVMQEPEVSIEPEPMPPVVVEEKMPVLVEDQSAEQKVMSLSPAGYAVQVYAGKNLESLKKFKANNGLDELMAVRTDRSGAIVYVLVDLYADRHLANNAAADLEARVGSKPWVRSVAGLQKIVAQ